ncbi:hypothetical protein NL676_009565 [Syzygium grande]|nr:hypothetical protein NL676_009565 [Syzygium grande]
MLNRFFLLGGMRCRIEPVRPVRGSFAYCPCWPADGLPSRISDRRVAQPPKLRRAQPLPVELVASAAKAPSLACRCRSFASLFTIQDEEEGRGIGGSDGGEAGGRSLRSQFATSERSRRASHACPVVHASTPVQSEPETLHSYPRFPFGVLWAIDQRTRMVLFKMLDRQVFNDINGCTTTGKEANVYHATKSDGQELAIKVYKTPVLVFNHTYQGH